MKSEWPIRRVSDLEDQGLLLVQDGNHGEYRPQKSEFVDIGIAFIRASDLGQGAVQFSSAEKINDVAFRRIRKGIGKDLDTILSTKGTVGKIAFVPKGSPQYVCSPQTSFWRSLDHDLIDPRYLYYEIQSHHFFNQIASRKGETDMADYLSLTSQRGLTIRVPSIKVQRETASILGSIDDKIELNRQINRTIEQISQTIFKSWFVDFDPVKAKIAAKQNGQNPERAAMCAISGKTDEGLNQLKPKQFQQLSATAALFPDELVDSELGEIPKGWEIGRLDDVLVLQRGFDLPTASRVDGPYPVIAASGHNGSHNEFMVQGPGVTTGRSGVLGKVFYVHGNFWPLNTSLWVKDFKRSTPAYAFHFLQGLDFALFNAGSAVPTLNRNHVHSLLTLIPSFNLILAFDGVAEALINQKRVTISESLTLGKIRDALLPKLVSEEIKHDHRPSISNKCDQKVQGVMND